MPKLQCPKCKQPIEIKALPADNRVKCGSCAAEFALKATSKDGTTKASEAKSSASGNLSGQSASQTSAVKTAPTKVAEGKPKNTGPTATAIKTAAATSAKQSVTATTAASTVDPNDPFASLDLNTLGKPRRVDLGVAPIPTGVAESPTAGNAPWLAGNQPVYAPLSEEEVAAAQAKQNPYQAAKPKKGRPVPKKSGWGVTIVVVSILALMAGGSIVAAIVVASR